MKLIAYTKEITWMSMVAHGWGNGYVAVPQEHPLYCKDYDDEVGVLRTDGKRTEETKGLSN